MSIEHILQGLNPLNDMKRYSGIKDMGGFGFIEQYALGTAKSMGRGILYGTAIGFLAYLTSEQYQPLKIIVGSFLGASFDAAQFSARSLYFSIRKKGR